VKKDDCVSQGGRKEMGKKRKRNPLRENESEDRKGQPRGQIFGRRNHMQEDAFALELREDGGGLSVHITI